MYQRRRFTLLGPVRAWHGRSELDLGSPQQHTVLAALLLRQGAPASVEELIDAVWGDDAPASAAGTVRTYIYRLRRQIDDAAEPATIRSVTGGYAADVAPDEVDLAVFHRLQAEAERAHRQGDPERAAELLRSALALWSGTPLAGSPGPYAERQRARLTGLRHAALQARLRADLDRGAHGAVVAELDALVAEHPFDEQLLELLMTAQYRSGRTADALAAFRDAQLRLTAELGAAPGPALQRLQRRILQSDPALTGGPAAPAAVPVPRVAPDPAGTAPAQLPAAVAGFAGRAAELAEADAWLAGQDGSGAPIAVVSGMAGIGASAFAVHWARRVAAAYPDGQLYLDLRGFDQGRPPLGADDAVGTLLQTIGIPAERLPAEPDARAAVYRDHLADRRMIIVLDNVRDLAQVRPLLAGGPRCLIVVTSRRQLGGLVALRGAHPIQLGALSGAEARTMLARRLGDARVAAEPDAVGEIVERCAGVPLALAAVAARAASRPTFPLADIVAVAPRGLDAFTCPGVSPDLRGALRASYATLSAAAARMFRRLADLPTEITPATATGGAAVGTRCAHDLLAELTDANLLTEVAPERYAFHPLVRLYAAELSGADTGHRPAGRWAHSPRRTNLARPDRYTRPLSA